MILVESNHSFVTDKDGIGRNVAYVAFFLVVSSAAEGGGEHKDSVDEVRLGIFHCREGRRADHHRLTP